MCEMWWCLLIFLAMGRRYILEIAGKLPKPPDSQLTVPLLDLKSGEFSCSFLLLLVSIDVQ